MVGVFFLFFKESGSFSTARRVIKGNVVTCLISLVLIPASWGAGVDDRNEQPKSASQGTHLSRDTRGHHHHHHQQHQQRQHHHHHRLTTINTRPPAPRLQPPPRPPLHHHHHHHKTSRSFTHIHQHQHHQSIHTLNWQVTKKSGTSTFSPTTTTTISHPQLPFQYSRHLQDRNHPHTQGQ